MKFADVCVGDRVSWDRSSVNQPAIRGVVKDKRPFDCGCKILWDSDAGSFANLTNWYVLSLKDMTILPRGPRAASTAHSHSLAAEEKMFSDPNAEYRFFSKVKPGNCPCDTLRSQCRFHK